MTELVRGIARNVRGFARPPQQQGDGPVVLEVNGRTVRLDMPAAATVTMSLSPVTFAPMRLSATPIRT